MRTTALSFLMAELVVGSVLGIAHAHIQQPVVLFGRTIAVEARVVDGCLQERYLASRAGTWVEVASSAERGSTGPVSVIAAGERPLSVTAQNVALAGETLVEELAAGPHRVLRKLTIVGDGAWIHVVTRLEPAGSQRLHCLRDSFKFGGRPDWSFSPSVGGFVPDGQYKAPLILVQAEHRALGIVPDLATLHREELKRCSHALDLDVPAGPLLSVGFMPARRAYHSVYQLDPDRHWTIDQPLENAYYLLITASAEPGQAYRRAARLHWDRFGRPAQAQAARQQEGTAWPPQRLTKNWPIETTAAKEQGDRGGRYQSLRLWDEWRKVVWQRETPDMWLAVPLTDGSIGGGVATRRWGPGPSVYLSSWFNTLRTSYGMALYARRTGDEELLKRARQTVELALKAPGRDGAFKCIAVPAAGDKPTAWAAGDGCGSSVQDGFLGYDMSWTAYWLLRWRRAGLPGHEVVLPRCERLADFLIGRQMPDGMLPTRFGEDGSVQEETSRTVKAETGPVVLFLLELFAQDRRPKYLVAARKGIDFIEQHVIPERQWYDYETFWSCSPRKVQFDERTRQWPANNLALGQTVAALLAAHRVTGEPRYLATGESLLDYLLLYQQCWTNPVLDDLSCPQMLLGGFTTQNSDAEWSDARQSQCGNVLMDYYRATGKAEYLERGVAALRAQFPISPSENWAHEGYGKKAGISSYHWGTGSGMAGIEIEEDFLRDAIVDVAAGSGVGVNGLNMTECVVAGAEIRLALSSPFDWPRRPTVVFRRTIPSKRYRLTVNGTVVGMLQGSDLQKGIAVPVGKTQ